MCAYRDSVIGHLTFPCLPNHAFGDAVVWGMGPHQLERIPSFWRFIMAINFNVPSASSNNAGNNESWKAQAFLNLFVRKPDGSRMKIGAIPLKTGKKAEAALIDRLQKEDGIDALKQVLDIDFQLVDDGKAVDLGF